MSEAPAEVEPPTPQWGGAALGLRVPTLLVFVVWLPIILRWGPLPHTLTYDDAYYYFQIGRNIADGQGSTFDGLHTTNGYHPLWMVACALVYLLGFDDLAAVRAVLVFQLALWVAALAVLAGAIGGRGWWRLEARPDLDPVARRRSSIVLGVIWFCFAANPYVLKTFVNGMETGMVALTSALLLALAMRIEGDVLRRPVALGVLASAAFLARTDFALIAAPLFVYAALVRRPTPTARLLGAAGGFGAVVAAYMLVNIAMVGHPLQISGVMKRVDPDAAGWATSLVLVALAALVLRSALRLRHRPNLDVLRLPRAARWYANTAWYGAGCLLLLAYDWGFTREVYLWHYAPHLLWGAMLFVAAAADIVEGSVIERPSDERRAARQPLVIGAALTLPLVAGVAVLGAGFVDPELYSLQLGDRAAGEWISENLPADAVVGSYDAGVIGYFADRPVVNLDGLVNSFEWRDALGEGPSATSAFLDDAGVSYLANHDDPVNGEGPSLASAADELWGPGTADRLALRHRIDYVFTGTAGGVSGRRPYATFVYELEPPE